MTERGTKKRYDKPPIVEAAVNLRFVEKLPFDAIETMARKLKRHYQTIEPELSVHFDISEQIARRIPVASGQRLTSSDQSEIAILRQQDLVVAQLAPYPGWEGFLARVERDRRVWDDVAGFGKLGRVGVRFINRIDVPLVNRVKIRPHDVLTIYPVSPPLGSEKIDAYTMQVVKSLERDGCRAQITSGLVESPVPGSVSFLLDIDVFKDLDLPAKEADLWPLLDRFRSYKNMVFEACITDSTRALFS